jgi:carbohydrate-selective porin OprB
MKHPYSRSHGASAIVAVAAAALMAVSPVRSAFYEQAGTAGSAAPVEKPSKSWLSEWWSGKYATGNWFGVRDTLEDHGLTLGGRWIGVYYGVVDGGKPNFRGSYFDEEIKFTGELNFAKLTGWEPLEGLKAFGEVRWRDGLNPNLRVGASPNFQPSHLQSGKQWRLMTFGLTYTTPELFGIKDFLTVTGGWLQPQKEFIEQPLSKLFVNNAFESSKGIGANIPFSSSFSTWGGTLKIKPVDWYYAKAGLFMAYPQATSTDNHGLAFEGFGPDPSQNGVFAIGETGFTPKLGASKLPGKYAFGGFYYEQDNNSFFGTPYSGFYGFYWQIDQMLFREPSPEEPAPLAKGPSDGKSVADGKSGKSFKEPVPTTKPKLSDQGLSFFSLFTYGPKYNNILPFYFHTGLVYKGLIPTRDDDQLMAVFGFGQYSFFNIQALQAAGNVNQPNYTAVLEVDYRIQINKWAFFQPYLQYIIQPNGTGAIENATVLGFETGVIF